MSIATAPRTADNLAAAVRGLRVILLRELIIFRRDRPRVAGTVGQPIFYLVFLGMGLNASVQLIDAPPGVDYLQFMFPGVIGMNVLFTAMFSSTSIIWDRSRGLLRAVLVAPVPRYAVALGKILGGAIVACLQSLIILALSPLVGIPLSPVTVVAAAAVAFLASIPLAALGVAVAARMDSVQGFHMILNFLIMPIFFLSGALYPVSQAPAWMQALMWANPMTYGVDALRGLLVPGAFAAFSLGVDVAVLAGFGVVLTAIAAIRFGKID